MNKNVRPRWLTFKYFKAASAALEVNNCEEMSETKSEIMIVDEKSLRKKIYVIRGQQVMLDYDLTEIYGYSKMIYAVR